MIQATQPPIPADLHLIWDATGWADLPAHGLTFTVSDEHGEEDYGGFYWREESENRAHGGFASPGQAQDAAQDWVLREVPRMAFLLDIEVEEAQEEGILPGYYLLRPSHRVVMDRDDSIHDATGLIAALNRTDAPALRFESEAHARAEVSAKGLILHDPRDYSLI